MTCRSFNASNIGSVEIGINRELIGWPATSLYAEYMTALEL